MTKPLPSPLPHAITSKQTDVNPPRIQTISPNHEAAPVHTHTTERFDEIGGKQNSARILCACGRPFAPAFDILAFAQEEAHSLTTFPRHPSVIARHGLASRASRCRNKPSKNTWADTHVAASYLTTTRDEVSSPTCVFDYSASQTNLASRLPIIRICAITATCHFKLKSIRVLRASPGTSFSSRSHGASRPLPRDPPFTPWYHLAKPGLSSDLLTPSRVDRIATHFVTQRTRSVKRAQRLSPSSSRTNPTRDIPCPRPTIS